MQERDTKTPLLLGTVMATLVLVWAAPLLAQSELLPAEGIGQPLSRFVPRPDAVSIERTGEAGEVRVLITLDEAERARLAAVQGFDDAIVLDQDGQALIFRDDGTGADVRGGDGVFTEFAQIDEADLADRVRAQPARSVDEPIFVGRELVGRAPVAPLDLDGFLAGQPLTLEASVPDKQAGVPTKVVVPGTNAFQDAVLMIRDPLIVADPSRTFDACTGAGTPMGRWTFGFLMEQMANQPDTGIPPSLFVERWLEHWLTNQTINSFTVPQRLAMQNIINDWRTASGGGDLDLRIAPFRLLAIVPRIDLRHARFLHSGEARFVFGVVIPASYSSNGSFIGSSTIPGTGGCEALSFSVILEYRVPSCSCRQTQGWAAGWAKLGSVVFGGSDYFSRLDDLTKSFSIAGADTLQPNENAISQVRTNEVAQAIPWELREFRLTTAPFSLLNEQTTADTPDDSFNNTVTFSNFVMGGVRPVPLFFGGSEFLGANPQVPNPFTMFWNGPGLTPGFDLQRHLVSLGTCNGCHGRETDTVFVHIDPATAGLPATLSGFLTGLTVNDPVTGTPRDFDDLERREKDLKRFLDTPCLSIAVSPLIASSAQAQLDAKSTQTVTVSLGDLLRAPVTQVH